MNKTEIATVGAGVFGVLRLFTSESMALNLSPLVMLEANQKLPHTKKYVQAQLVMLRWLKLNLIQMSLLMSRY